MIIGASPPPPGVVPNFENPESIGYRVIIAAVLGPVVALPICCIRWYTKQYILKNIGCDDYAILFAVISALGLSISTGIHTTNGLGNHIWDVPSEKFYVLMKVGDIAGPIFYNSSTLCIKVSLCLFYLRLSPFLNFRIAVYVVMVISIIYNLLAGFGFLWVCQPVAKYWDYSILTGRCINLSAFFLATAVINAITDVLLLVLPGFIVKDLHLPRGRKIGVALLLMVGSFVCVVSFIRVQIVVEYMHNVVLDGTWAMVANFVLLIIEVWMGIICTCLPSVHTFVRKRVVKHNPKTEVNVAAVQDPNSGFVNANIISDSGYSSGEITNLELDTVDVESQAGNVTSVHPAASQKDLTASISRCED